MKINLSYKEININTFFCIILIIGFLTIGIIPAVFKMNSQIITIPFRAVVLFLSIFIIIRNFYTKQINKFGLTEFMFIVFWFFYLFKAFLTFRNYTFSEELNINESETYLRILGIAFIPSLAVLTIQSKKQIGRAHV